MNSTAMFATSLLFALGYLVAPDNWLLDPFRFKEQPIALLRESVVVFCMAWAFAFAGHLVSARTVAEPPRSLNKRSSVVPIVVFALLSVFIITKILLAVDSIGASNLEERVFIDKSSKYVLLLYGTVCYLSLQQRRAATRLTLETVLFIACFLIAVVDSTREALIPAAFILAFYLQLPGHRVRFLIWTILTSALLVLVMIRRDFTLADALQQELGVLIVYFVEAIGYITAFNLLHFGEVFTAGLDTDFSFHYLILSILPFPSSMIGAEVLESRNFDAYRPYGAAADMLSLNIFVFAIYWALFGWVAHKSTQVSGILRVVLAALLLILFVTSFQYALRTSSKFFTLVIMLLAARYLVRTNITRRHGGRKFARRHRLGKPVVSTNSSTLQDISPSVPKATT